MVDITMSNSFLSFLKYIFYTYFITDSLLYFKDPLRFILQNNSQNVVERQSQCAKCYNQDIKQLLKEKEQKYLNQKGKQGRKKLDFQRKEKVLAKR